MKTRALVCLFVLSSFQLWAQPQNPQQDPDAVPITGLEYLLIGGGAYGVSRLLKNRRKKNNQS